MKCGYGKHVWSSGNYYEGEWFNDERNGNGTMYWTTTNEKYIGNWIDG